MDPALAAQNRTRALPRTNFPPPCRVSIFQHQHSHGGRVKEGKASAVGLRLFPRMGKVRTQAVVWLAILLSCCVSALALDPSLDISQYAHTAWTVRDGFFKGVDQLNCSDARRLSLAGHGIRLASLRWRSGRPMAAAAGEHLPEQQYSKPARRARWESLDWHQ